MTNFIFQLLDLKLQSIKIKLKIKKLNIQNNFIGYVQKSSFVSAVI